tara:strand:+ start:103 stop:573 length:471 start_codon:yes stop_codon:yes gene_type:complete
MLDSYGKLYILDNNVEGEWIKNIINNISKLYYSTVEKSKDFPNGIKTDIKYRGFKNRIGEELSKFLVNCYIIKRIKKSKPNGEVFTYLTPVNTILDSINNKSNYLEEIDVIFNHPHFKDCKDIDEIKGMVEKVENLNNRKKIIVNIYNAKGCIKVS